jgi:hypothetical protein
VKRQELTGTHLVTTVKLFAAVALHLEEIDEFSARGIEAMTEEKAEEVFHGR